MLQIMIKQIYRRPRYPLALAIGIILAVGLIVGINMTIDNMTGLVFQKQLEQTPVDFIASKNIYNLTDLPDTDTVKNRIFQVNYIKGVEVTWQLRIYGQFFNETPFYGNASLFENITRKEPVEIQERWQSPVIMGVPLDFGTNVTGFSWIDGSFDKNNNFSVDVPSDFADKFNLSVGDTFYLISEQYHYDPLTGNMSVTINNLELKVSGIYEFTSILAKVFSPSQGPDLYFVTTFASAYEIYNNVTGGQVEIIEETQEQVVVGPGGLIFGGYYPVGNFRVYIFIDRDAVIVPYNIDLTNERLQKIENSLMLQLADQDFYINNKLSDALQYVSFWALAARTQFGIFSVPVILLGAFLTTTVAYVLLEERRREIGLMKIRGATDTQIRKLLAYESITIGLVAGIVGLFLASGFTAYFTSRLATLWEIEGPQLSYLPSLNFNTYFGITLAFILSAIAGYLPSKTAANLTPIESIESHIEDIEAARWKPKWTILWLILGGYKIVVWILGIQVVDIWSLLMQPNFFIVIAIVIFLFIDSILQYVAPFLFIYSATKIVTMKAYKLTNFFSSIIKPIGGNISKVAVGGVLRKPSRYARVGFIIALAIGFGIMISISQATNYDYQIRLVRVSAGADINLSAYTTNLTMYDNITKISGVTNITGLFRTYEQIGNTQLEIIGINPAKYLSVSRDYIDDDFTEKGMKLSIKQMITNQSYILASKGFFDTFDVKTGDDISLKFKVNETTSVTLNLTVIDRLLAMPGESWLFISSPIIVVSLDLLNGTGLLNKYLSSGGVFDHILVDVAESANVTRVAEEIKDLYKSVSVYVAKEHIEEIEEDPIAMASVEFLNIDYLLMILIATIGLGFIMFMAVIERQKEFGIMIARGASASQIIRLLLAESTIIMIVSVVIGAITGFAAGYGISTYINTISIIQMVPVRVVIPFTAYYIVIGSIIAFFIATIIPAYLASKTNIREVLHLG